VTRGEGSGVKELEGRRKLEPLGVMIGDEE